MMLFDLSSLSAGMEQRNAAIHAALETGKPTASEPIDIYDDYGGLGYVMYQRIGLPGDGFGDLPIGVVGTAFDSTVFAIVLPSARAAMVEAGAVAAGTEHALPYHYTIEDVGPPARTLLDEWYPASAASAVGSDEEHLLYDGTGELGGRDWRITVATSAKLIADQVDSERSALVFAVGIMATVLIAGIVWLGSRAQAQREKSRRMHERVAATTHARVVSYICHEMRNPLHALMGGLDLFLHDHMPLMSAAMRADIDSLLQSAAQMKSVLNDVLDIRRLDGGHVDVEEAVADVRALVRDLLHQMRDAASPNTILLQTVSKDLPPLMRVAVSRMRQVVGNALHNAAKFTDEGYIECIVRVVGAEGGATYLLVEVRNTGRGLGGRSEEELLGVVKSVDADPAAFPALPSPIARSKDESESTPSPPPDDVVESVRAWFAESMTMPLRESATLARQFESHAVIRRSAVSSRRPLLPAVTTPNRHVPEPSALGPMGHAVVGGGTGVEAAAGAGIGQAGDGRGDGSPRSSAGIQADAHVNAGVNMLLRATGLGLGLPLCNRVMESVGGVMGIHDAPRDRFTRCWMLFPVKCDEDFDVERDGVGGAGTIAWTRSGTTAAPISPTATLEADMPFTLPGVSNSSSADTESKAAVGPPMHVVAVDDEPVLRRLIGRFLKVAGATYTIFEDGSQVTRDALIESKAQVLLLDIVMLRSDGCDVCRRLRAQGVDLPIYAMTGNTDGVSVERFREVGFTGVLSKPFNATDVHQVLRHAATTSTPRLWHASRT